MRFCCSFFALFCPVFFPALVLAAGGGGGDYDLLPRTINFLIFLAILIYFTAKPLKNFYKNRILKIATRLDEIQKKLLESKSKKLDLIKKLEEARAGANEALILAKKEAAILAQAVAAQTQNELTLMEKYFEEQKDYELRKMEKELISQALDELFARTRLSQEQIIGLMMRGAK